MPFFLINLPLVLICKHTWTIIILLIACSLSDSLMKAQWISAYTTDIYIPLIFIRFSWSLLFLYTFLWVSANTDWYWGYASMSMHVRKRGIRYVVACTCVGCQWKSFYRLLLMFSWICIHSRVMPVQLVAAREEISPFTKNNNYVR